MPRRDSSDTEAKPRPKLRDRLREVLERDRALAGAEAGDSQPGWPMQESSDHGFGAPESGTRRRPAQAYETDGLHTPPKELPQRDILDDLLELQEQYDREQERARLEALAFEAVRSEREDGFVEALDPQEALALRETLLGSHAEPLASTEALVLHDHETNRDGGALALDLMDAGDGLASASLFADWIAEEIAELSESSSAPLALSFDEPSVAAPAPASEREADASVDSSTDTAVDTRAEAPGVAAIEIPQVESAVGSREPIQTRTMARLLAGHGYRARALSIYDELLRKNPNQPELRAEAEALRKSP